MTFAWNKFVSYTTESFFRLGTEYCRARVFFGGSVAAVFRSTAYSPMFKVDMCAAETAKSVAASW